MNQLSDGERKSVAEKIMEGAYACIPSTPSSFAKDKSQNALTLDIFKDLFNPPKDVNGDINKRKEWVAKFNNLYDATMKFKDKLKKEADVGWRAKKRLSALVKKTHSSIDDWKPPWSPP